MKAALSLAPAAWKPPRPFVQASATLVCFLGLAYTLTVLFQLGVRWLVPDRFWGWALSMAMAGAVIVAYVVIVRVIEGRWPVELRVRRIPEFFGGFLLAGLAVLGLVALGLAKEWIRLDGGGGLAVVWAGLGAGIKVIALALAVIGVAFRHLELAFGTLIALILSALVTLAIAAVGAGMTGWQLVVAVIAHGVFLPMVFALSRSLWLVLGYGATWTTLTTPVLGAAVGVPAGSPTSGGADGLAIGAFTLFAYLVACLLLALGLRFARRVRWLAPRCFSVRVGVLTSADAQAGDGTGEGLQ